jgi:MFS family permease
MLWRLVVLSALFGFLFGFDEGVIAVALPFIGKQFAISAVAEGFMTAAVPLGAVAGAVIAAVWSDRFGRRRVLWRALCYSALDPSSVASHPA